MQIGVQVLLSSVFFFFLLCSFYDAYNVFFFLALNCFSEMLIHVYDYFGDFTVVCDAVECHLNEALLFLPMLHFFQKQ